MRADTWVRPYKYFYYLYERILVLAQARRLCHQGDFQSRKKGGMRYAFPPYGCYGHSEGGHIGCDPKKLNLLV